MALSVDVAREFVKTVTSQSAATNNTLKGTIKTNGDDTYVQLDGSDQLTPISSTVTGLRDGDRVLVQIKDHKSTVLGNTSNPSISTTDYTEGISEINTFIAQKIDADQLEAAYAYVKTLVADKATLDSIKAGDITVDEVIAKKLEAGEIDADMAKILNLTAGSGIFTNIVSQYLTVEDFEATTAKFNNISTYFARATELDATNARIDNITAGEITADNLDAKVAEIIKLGAESATVQELNADYLTVNFANIDSIEAGSVAADNLDAAMAKVVQLSAQDAELTNAFVTSLDAKYANIDFSNIGDASIENLYAYGGVIQDLTIEDGTVTGTLGAINLNADNITAGTMKADRLLLLGDDGLYYRLNTEGVTEATEQDKTNALDGSVILAKSITADHISVSDLAAFEAQIAGLNMTEGILYSGVKESMDNTTSGFYLDKDGQVNIGDESNYIKFFKTTNEAGEEDWKLEISADSLANIIRDENGNSMMEQASDGTWMFDFKKVTDRIDSSAQDVTALKDQVNLLIQNTTSDGVTFVSMGTAAETDDDGAETEVPALVLGKDGSELSLKITDRSINFMQGGERVAYMTGDLFHIRSGVLTEELHLGEQSETEGSWIWKKRANEHLGLRYAKPLTDGLVVS